MLTCGCNESTIPKPGVGSSSVFDTLAMPSAPTPTHQSLKDRLRRIIFRLHPDRRDEVVTAHCAPFGVNIEAALDLHAWLCGIEGQEHFEQHWRILGHSGEERASFPWNPLGSLSKECALAVDRQGQPFCDSGKASSIPFAPAPHNF